MPNRPDLEDASSRANGNHAAAEERPANEGGLVTDGKMEDVPQGGKRRGPGRWINPKD